MKRRTLRDGSCMLCALWLVAAGALGDFSGLGCGVNGLSSASVAFFWSALHVLRSASKCFTTTVRRSSRRNCFIKSRVSGHLRSFTTNALSYLRSMCELSTPTKKHEPSRCSLPTARRRGRSSGLDRQLQSLKSQWKKYWHPARLKSVAVELSQSHLVSETLRPTA